jgi:DNA-binding transcriptional MerR regulator
MLWHRYKGANMTYTIGTVAKLAYVSVRTLHYYDETGLLSPSNETAAGYRLYSDADLDMLQQVLFFRELGFPLATIGSLVHSPSFDRRKALQAHREALLERRKQVDALLDAIDRTMQSLNGGTPMDKQEMFDAFDERALEEHRAKYADEVEERWGTTDAYAESQKRTSKYTKEDWARIKQESDQIEADMAALMDRNPSDPQVQDVVRRKHEHFNRNFYTCSFEMLAGLSEMWVSDPRFTVTYDKIKPGLAQFWHDAVQAYCAADGKK